MTRMVVIGEGMLELASDHGAAQLSYGGDTLNTAVYLSRLGVRPDYVTALGVDSFSNSMKEAFDLEGLGSDFILRHPVRLPGLYVIKTEISGERSFFYWRENSAARAFFDIPNHQTALDYASGADWLYLSGITLSIFDQAGRDKLTGLAETVKRKGAHIAFDPNYRAQGWNSQAAALAAMVNFAPHLTLVLPTLEDEDALFGQASAEDHAQRWHDWGVQDVIMKVGPAGAIIFQQGRPPLHVPVETPVKPVDTTGAGDSFNAGFIAAIISGQSFVDAARAGSFLAGQVIQHSGAIIPKTAMPKQISEQTLEFGETP